MILKCGLISSVDVTWRKHPMRPRIVCLASDFSTEQLRAQLDQLLFEAKHTRSKEPIAVVAANNARLRLIRLSEAAEKLRRQAAISIQTGRENDARELLYQKKKVMEALEKSKTRIQLLDELSFKLNEAISSKETQLIDNVASDLDIVTDDASNKVRIVSPKDEDTNLNVDEILEQNTMELTGDQELLAYVDQPDLPVCGGEKAISGALIGGVQNESDVATTIKGLSSFEDFIANVDQQLDKIETELDTVLRVSTLVLGGEEKLKYLRVQQTLDLLEGIRRIRERISIMLSQMMIR